MILVVGSKGMLGQELMALYGDAARGVDVDDIDITDLESVQRVLLTLKPSVVINAAAYTDVDGCQSNTELAMQVNGEGVAFLAMISKEIGAKLVQVSTDYIFDGKKGSPYLEDDLAAPLSVYGESKLAGEMNTWFNPDHLVVRTQWLYGHGGKNFVETMLKLGAEKKELTVVDDQIGSPTWTRDLALAIKALLDKGCQGTYHAANSGFVSWNGFAKEIFRLAGLDVAVLPMTTEQLNRPAPRPLYSTLDCGKLQQDTGFVPQPWQDALKRYLELRPAR
ncbi:dTDP-4-dehydrorhamnose reductase [Geomonas sp. Red69]|uniref:dTDP-4-dehydrorhamnose reductase n=1 Tax=Geomonas diazotrophica TaxID=2843197 RepID=A0ABX8JMJ5_9BACT|nr:MULTISPECIES: dTDP-4-dehydrorhamnose reductase [Geomonas]MBU5638647.1 dTDP-4-dehydrorhamnose reductase [Geomonas diazotrophica]QWV98321.1 dTDP-4-dehydrorhamnose reductase [Geomonas nitrogeniifigens]QXE87505.1 dTDP-4-dehydrorhamnose reductase [Geomonas nitrogeniifigens]